MKIPMSKKMTFNFTYRNIITSIQTERNTVFRGAFRNNKICICCKMTKLRFLNKDENKVNRQNPQNKKYDFV